MAAPVNLKRPTSRLFSKTNDLKEKISQHQVDLQDPYGSKQNAVDKPNTQLISQFWEGDIVVDNKSEISTNLKLPNKFSNS
jgi:hypothetical protein